MKLKRNVERGARAISGPVNCTERGHGHSGGGGADAAPHTVTAAAANATSSNREEERIMGERIKWKWNRACQRNVCQAQATKGALHALGGDVA